MENKVECKRCFAPFIYVPGPNGNARQLCDGCRTVVDAKEIEKLKEETIFEGNKYAVGWPKRKNKYDPTEIFSGNFPVFENDGERFICAMELGRFVRRNGFGGQEQNIANFMEYLGLPHSAIFLKQLTLQQMESMAKNKMFEKEFKNIMKACT